MSSHAVLPFDAVLLDLDGTLVDSAEDIRRALRVAFRAIDLDMDDKIEVLVDGSPLEEVFAAAVPGGTASEMREFVTAYRSAYAVGDGSTAVLYPGVRETLEAMRALGSTPKLAVATSKRQAMAEAVCASLGLAHLFDVIAGSGALPIAPKPAPDLLLRVAEILGIAPGRALMVGDTLRDVVSGQRAGMRTAAVTYGLGPVDALVAARPDYVLEEFDELLMVVTHGARDPRSPS